MIPLRRRTTGCCRCRCFTSPAGDSLALAGCRRRPDGARQTAAGAGATRLYSRLLVPTQLWRLLSGDDEVSLKAVLLGGAAIPVALTEQARRRGIRCWCGYGLTEFASTVCAKEADGTADVGLPLPGRELRIVDGEVWLRSDSMAAGYWRGGQTIPLTNADGWFATRDRGRLDNGRLTILGRMDNLFSGGEGIQPEEVERVIGAHPLIEQVLSCRRMMRSLASGRWR